MSEGKDQSLSARVRCEVCPHGCFMREGHRGLCRARVARRGQVVDENYGRVTALALDPIEKKPLVRFMPGSMVLSVGSYGCNLRCPFCQNSSLACASAERVAWRCLRPHQVETEALRLRERGNIGVAFTYNEPLVGYEWVRDVGRLIHKHGLKNIVVTNGMINAEPLHEIMPLIDAVNVDLKGFSPSFYQLVGGSLSAVKQTIKTLVASPSVHVEVTTLVIPGLNDNDEEIDSAARWLASLNPAIPYHLTRFYPCHQMKDKPPTPLCSLKHLKQLASRHLSDVNLGNV